MTAQDLKKAQDNKIEIITPLEEILFEIKSKANNSTIRSHTLAKRVRLSTELKRELEKLGYEVKYNVWGYVGNFRLWETEISW